MRYSLWAPEYARIAREFGFVLAEEERAALRLERLLPARARERPLERIATRLEGREAVIVGNAPGAGPPPLWRLPPPSAGRALVVADSATEGVLDAGLVPDVITTDLDGPVPAEVSANGRGCLVVVHAHGDNVSSLDRWVPDFPGELAGSWAGPPREGLIDVGGFTDGDRAVYLAEHVGARRILLWGFDLSRVDEAESAPRKVKERKLRAAQHALELLSGGARCPIERWDPDGSIGPFFATGTGNRPGR